MKKSQTTGSGAAEVYVSKWKHFDQCQLLEGVLVSTHPTVSNMQQAQDDSGTIVENSDDTDPDRVSVGSSMEEENTPISKKRKNKDGSFPSPWMEKAAAALDNLAKETAIDEDE